jgi:hypothetical protein
MLHPNLLSLTDLVSGSRFAWLWGVWVFFGVETFEKTVGVQGRGPQEYQGFPCTYPCPAMLANAAVGGSAQRS